MIRSFDCLAIAESRYSQFASSREALVTKLIATDPAVMVKMSSDYEASEDLSPLLEIYDNVGVVTISGGLTAEDSWLNCYFGLVSYGEIRKATLDAVNSGVGCILYNISSPGGDVDGMSDVANLIAALDIPTVAFASSQMASAAYFLGCQADYVYADAFADVGSIGVVIKVYDKTKYNEELGIKYFRFRSGDLKATGDPNFKLTDKEIKYIEEKVSVYADMFYNIVSDARGMSLQAMEKLGILTGRTFIGRESLGANLVDGIVTLDECMLHAYSLAQKTIDKRNQNGIPLRY